jgi:hypothetical protein
MKTRNHWLTTATILFTAILLIGCGHRQTKEEWKAKLSQNNQTFAVSGIVQMKKDDFVKLMGSPNKTETIESKVYWYYDCKDGTIQLEADAGALQYQGMLIGHANDY